MHSSLILTRKLFVDPEEFLAFVHHTDMIVRQGKRVRRTMLNGAAFSANASRLTDIAQQSGAMIMPAGDALLSNKLLAGI
jgi:hypothetical protein